MRDNTAPAIGHNMPPENADPIGERLGADHADLLKRRDELLAKSKALPACDDEKSAGTLGDFIKDCSSYLKDADGRRIKEKEPYLVGGRRVDGFFKTVCEAIEPVKRAISKKLEAYETKKEAKTRRLLAERAAAEKKAAEEAAEAAQRAIDAMASDDDLGNAMERETIAEAAAVNAAKAEKEAEQSAADLSRTRSEVGGSVSSLRTVWDFDGMDRAKIDLEALRPYIPVDGLEKAVRAFIKAGGRNLKGVRIYEDRRVVVR